MKKKIYYLFGLLVFPSILFCQSNSWQSLTSNIRSSGTIVGNGSFLAASGAAPNGIYIYSSLNKGVSWSSVATITWPANYTNLGIGFRSQMYFANGTLFCVTAAIPSGSGVFRSTDSGRTFNQIQGLQAVLSNTFLNASVWGYESNVFIAYTYSSFDNFF